MTDYSVIAYYLDQARANLDAAIVQLGKVDGLNSTFHGELTATVSYLKQRSQYASDLVEGIYPMEPNDTDRRHIHLKDPA